MTNSINIAIDLETLSVSREHLPAVWEIGAVIFDRGRPTHDCVVDELHRQTHPTIAELHGNSDQSTRSWLSYNRPCMEQIRSYPSALEMLLALAEMVDDYRIESRLTDLRWWAWGAEFDLRILQGLLERLIIPTFPLHYRQVRDARTYCTELADQFGIVLPQQDPDTKHNALDDARHCARLVTGVTQQMEVIRERAESGGEVMAWPIARRPITAETV